MRGWREKGGPVFPVTSGAPRGRPICSPRPSETRARPWVKAKKYLLPFFQSGLAVVNRRTSAAPRIGLST